MRANWHPFILPALYFPSHPKRKPYKWIATLPSPPSSLLMSFYLFSVEAQLCFPWAWTVLLKKKIMVFHAILKQYISCAFRSDLPRQSNTVWLVRLEESQKNNPLWLPEQSTVSFPHLWHKRKYLSRRILWRRKYTRNTMKETFPFAKFSNTKITTKQTALYNIYNR